MAQRVTVTIPRDTALPGDESTNTFHFRTLTGGVFTAAQAADVAEALRKFYFVLAPGATDTIASRMSAVNQPNLVTAAFYDLTTPAPRVPYAVIPLLPGAGMLATPQAEEVAVALTIQAAPVSGQNQRNRRGRIFLGPLGTGMVTIIGGRARVNVSFRSSVVAAAVKLQQDIRAIGANFDWIVWSPTTQQEHVVDSGWVDDAFDTIRSRGPAPTERTSFTI
jgi:hypothetical protein